MGREAEVLPKCLAQATGPLRKPPKAAFAPDHLQAFPEGG